MEKSQNRKPFQALRDLFHPVDLTHGTCWRTILQFSLPVILSYLLQQVYSISDAAIVGQTLTAQEVAGVNDTTSLVFIFLQFAFGVSAGFCVITSCCVGCRDQAGVRRSMAAQLVLSAGLTVLLCAWFVLPMLQELGLALLNPMLAWINVTPENPEVYRAAYTYCGIIFAGIGAQLFYNFICIPVAAGVLVAFILTILYKNYVKPLNSYTNQLKNREKNTKDNELNTMSENLILRIRPKGALELREFGRIYNRMANV